MNDFAGTNWDDNEPAWPHPAREQLLLYVDGELTEGEAGRVKGHLESCWNCRARVARIEETIAEFIRFDEKALTPHLPPPPSHWRGFDARLKNLVEENGKPSLISRLRSLGAGLPLSFDRARLAVVIAVACGVVIFVVWMARAPEVSTSVLLKRSIQAETERLSRVAEPVVYRKLQVRRKTGGVEESIAWESWRSAKSNQFRQRVVSEGEPRFLPAGDPSSPSLIADLEQIFRANHMDLQRPLSAAAYAEWRARIRPRAETVTSASLAEDNPAEGQSDGLTLTTILDDMGADQAIVEASLIVRRADWHAVAQRLKVQDEGEFREYELRETAYEILPLQALTVFADIAPNSAPTEAPVASAAATAPPPLSVAPTEVDLREAEVAALYALHQSQADLGEQIEIAREAGSGIVVSGIVEQAERKQRLAEALKNIPLVSARIQTVEEAVMARQASQRSSTAGAIGEAGVGSATPPVSAVEETASVATQGANVFQRKLIEYISGKAGENHGPGQDINQKVSQFSNSAVSRASATLSTAWALRRLTERFVLAPDDKLNTTARQRIAEMMINHCARLKAQSHELHAQLRPVLALMAEEAPATAVAPSPTDSTRSEQALLVFRTVERISQLTYELAGGKGSSASTTGRSSRQLLADFERLDGELLRLEQLLAR
jgi:anti-sigma factor RsiW